MIKELILSPLIKLGMKVLDDTIPVEIIHKFVADNLEMLSASDENAIFNVQEIGYLSYANNLYKSIQNPEKRIDFEDIELTSIDNKEISDWIEELPKNKIISYRGLVPRSGEMMLSLLEHQDSQSEEFLDTQIENLLRIVEIKKKRALDHKYIGFENVQEKDKQIISILFSRIARKRKDVRFLNAALKLNDWSFPSYQRIKAGPALLYFLLALVEAEYSVQELLK